MQAPGSPEENVDADAVGSLESIHHPLDGPLWHVVYAPFGQQSGVVAPRRGRLGQLHVVVKLGGHLHVRQHLVRLGVGVVHHDGRAAPGQRSPGHLLAPLVRLSQPRRLEHVVALSVDEEVVGADHGAVPAGKLFGQGRLAAAGQAAHQHQQRHAGRQLLLQRRAVPAVQRHLRRGRAPPERRHRGRSRRDAGSRAAVPPAADGRSPRAVGAVGAGRGRAVLGAGATGAGLRRTGAAAATTATVARHGVEVTATLVL